MTTAETLCRCLVFALAALLSPVDRSVRLAGSIQTCAEPTRCYHLYLGRSAVKLMNVLLVATKSRDKTAPVYISGTNRVPCTSSNTSKPYFQYINPEQPHVVKPSRYATKRGGIDNRAVSITEKPEGNL